MNNDNTIMISRKKLKTVINVSASVIIGTLAAFCLHSANTLSLPDNGRGIFDVICLDLAMGILGVILLLCVSTILFSFIKPRKWKYTVLYAVLSLALGGILLKKAFSLMGEGGEHFWQYIFASVIYSVAVFGISILVRFIYTKIQKKKVITAEAAA